MLVKWSSETLDNSSRGNRNFVKRLSPSNIKSFDAQLTCNGTKQHKIQESSELDHACRSPFGTTSFSYINNIAQFVTQTSVMTFCEIWYQIVMLHERAICPLEDRACWLLVCKQSIQWDLLKELKPHSTVPAVFISGSKSPVHNGILQKSSCTPQWLSPLCEDADSKSGPNEQSDVHFFPSLDLLKSSSGATI